MTDPFHIQIRKAISNPGLQVALDANAQRRLDARRAAAASLPEDLAMLRRKAHAVRQETILHLDRYLAQFIEHAQENGLIVHRAATAAEAVALVLQVARLHGARRIAKSKTMVSEEIGLNHALEAAGLEVVETDLGEFIVQLRGERPAHIITPAVHLRRSDVGQTFFEKLGLPLTDDIPTMTAAARRELRQVFLSAGLGVSGVNFGVADTGALCLATNEGNGRMVTTLPPVHVALMGIERLVPTLDDLGLMLTLLPRHATGQKLTVYTSLIHSPRRPGEADGPLERHLILVDNGRERLRRSPLSEALLCIRCGACLNACPVFREIGGHAYVSAKGEGSPYPGPIGSILSPALFGQPEFGQLARASTLCGACREACPVDIDLPKLLLRVRAGEVSEMGDGVKPNAPASLRLALGAFTWLATGRRRFAAAQKLASLGSRLLAPISPWLRLPAITGWGSSKDFPRPAGRSFHERWHRRVSNGEGRARMTDEASSREPGKDLQGPGGPIPNPVPAFSASTADLQDRFAAELQALGGQVIACAREELARRILDVLQAHGIDALQSWESGHLPGGLLPALEQAGIRITHAPDPALRAGLTGALAGVAETGTLAVTGRPGQPLTASLLPEVHLAVLGAAQIYETLGEVLHLPEVRQSSAVALISGPSRTADIEMTLTIGVHGPGEVVVFLWI